MGRPEMEQIAKVKASDPPVRRSPRISSQAKPTPSLIAAKKNAIKKAQGAKKQPVFSFANDIYQTSRDAKDMVKMDTGLVYDNKMIEHECLWDKNYPENPQRFISVIKRCSELGLINRCKTVESRAATEEELLSCHTLEHLNIIKALKDCQDQVYLESMASKYDATYFHPSTYQCALLSAGSSIDLIDQICQNRIQNGMAIIRPPGHHAMKSEFCGYCYFNNAAVAAHAALKAGVNRILIVDWDVHHGQATQQMFYNDKRVLYFSIHRYEHGTFWPNLRESDLDNVGEEPARGYNINVPLNATGMTDADYLAVFHHILLPVAYQFQPELVIVSAGYDAALGCPEYGPELVIVSAGYDSALGDEKGEMELSPPVYAHLLTSLMSLANGKVAVLLEGGYNLQSLAEGAALTLRALLGDHCPSLPKLGKPSKSMIETILNVMYVQREYWRCLRVLSVHSIYDPVSSSEEEPRHVPKIKYKHNDPKPDKYETRNCYPVQSAEFLKRASARLTSIINNTKLLSPSHKVCFVYDEKMMNHRNLAEVNHIEKPQRISSIFNMHKEYDLLDRLHSVSSRYATEEEIRYVHGKDHLNEMKNLSKLSPKELQHKKEIFHSVYFHHESFETAKLAAGSLLQVVDSVLTGESGCGVAVVRPPGHHADIDEPCGFCIFNSVAIAARHAIKVHGLKRVLILDWDVHHGNGTQEIFYEDANVLYISIHRFDDGAFFPHTGDGGVSHVGRADGEGFNVNIPWNKSGMGNGDYVAAFFQVVLPIAYEYDPELVLVSAGFDAAVGDPLGGCQVTPEAYGHFTHWLKGLAGGKVILTLEGGYNVHSISHSMVLCTKALLGDPLPCLKPDLAPCHSAINSIRDVVTTHAQYWTSVKVINYSLPLENVFTQRHQQKNERDLILEGDLLDKLKLKEASDSPEKSGGNDGGGGGGGGGASGGGSGSGQDGQPGPSSSQSGIRPTQTLTEFLADNIQAIVNEQMFAVVPLPTCPHLPAVEPVPLEGINTHLPCVDCQDPSENWICLTCYTVHCGRYINEHMMNHNLESAHPLTLSFSDLSVWCYPCQAYIDNPVLHPAKNAAHRDKFGTDLQWSYHTAPNFEMTLD